MNIPKWHTSVLNDSILLTAIVSETETPSRFCVLSGALQVCPVCVQTPHGDPQYYSRNFIGHLNLRHCYYLEDITVSHAHQRTFP